MIENGAYNTSKKRLAFCGFFPAESPKYSCMVLTCHPTKNFFGAATTSGQVLRNIAMKLYSRGLLGNSSEYASSMSSSDGPTFYATRGEDPFKKLRGPLAIPKGKNIKSPSAVRSGVPDVRGLSVREAVVTLESAGYNVKFTGSGFVHTQSPSPGTLAGRGAVINLALTR